MWYTGFTQYMDWLCASERGQCHTHNTGPPLAPSVMHLASFEIVWEQKEMHGPAAIAGRSAVLRVCIHKNVRFWQHEHHHCSASGSKYVCKCSVHAICLFCRLFYLLWQAPTCIFHPYILLYCKVFKDVVVVVATAVVVLVSFHFNVKLSIFLTVLHKYLTVCILVHLRNFSFQLLWVA